MTSEEVRCLSDMKFKTRYAFYTHFKRMFRTSCLNDSEHSHFTFKSVQAFHSGIYARSPPSARINWKSEFVCETDNSTKNRSLWTQAHLAFRHIIS